MPSTSQMLSNENGQRRVPGAHPAQRFGRELIAFARRARPSRQAHDRFTQHRLHQFALALTGIQALALRARSS